MSETKKRSTLGKITRRGLLFGSAVIAGGVAFGIYAYQRPAKNPLPDIAEAGETPLTPYLLIRPEGITLITPQADIGQGAQHIQAALIAEELDVSLDQVDLSFGPPSPAYYNTALSQEAAPFPATDTGFLAEAARALMDAPMKFIGLQITGGSTTVPDGFEKLRMAGAAAREALKQAASERSGVDIADLTTRDGAVLLPDGTALPYTELAEDAARIGPPARVELRSASDWRLLGQPMQRLDMAAKCTGAQRYAIDVDLPDMLHAAVRINPRLGAGVASYDSAAALELRGVERVIEIPNGLAVIADSTWRAMKGAEALEIAWDAAPYPAEQDGHWQILSESFTEDRIETRPRDDGDVETALREGADWQAEYRAPYLAHAPLEPASATVQIKDGTVTIWTGTQIPRFVQANAARIAGVAPEAVVVHNQMIGGSFGHRLEDEIVRQATHIAMATAPRPVKLTWSREEDMTHDYPRQIAMARGRGRVAEGRIEAFDLAIAMPTISGSQLGRQGLGSMGADMQMVAGAWDQPFAVPNLRVTAHRAEGLAPVSSWRSVGASTNAFFHEGMMDELIHAAGADPLQARLDLCTHDASREVLEALGEISDWGRPLGANEGRGLAFCLSFGVPVGEVVDVEATEDGIRILRAYVVTNTGPVLDPVNFENLVQGGVLFGLSHAIGAEITYADGVAEQQNFDSFLSLRLSQTPEITLKALETAEKIRGIGEPPVPPAAPALANAIFAATGQRLREMPFNKTVGFV